MPSRIIFFKIASFSHINENVERVLKTHFPDCELMTVDLWEKIRADKVTFVINIISILMEYGFDLLLGRKKLNECLFITPYIFRKMKKIAGRYSSKPNTFITFQTQSLFDAKYGSVPHFIYTDHTFLENKNYPEFDQGKMPSERWLKLEKTIYEHANINFTMSSNITRSMIHDYKINAEKVKCVWAGSNLELNSLMQQKRNYNAKQLLFVGRRWERKGGPNLIKAFEKVLEVHPDAHLTIIGCKPEVNLRNVTVTGNISLNEVAEYYSRASIFCLPTKLEPFGIVFLEAMMYSLPIVATNIGAIPDFVNEGSGILVDPNNINGLSEAIIHLLDNPEICRRYGERGFKIYQEKYTWENVGVRMSESVNGSLNHSVKQNTANKFSMI